MAAGGNRWERIVAALFAAQRRQPRPARLRRAAALVQIGLQHRVRPDLDKDPEAGADQRGHAVGEAYRAADVAPPVLPRRVVRRWRAAPVTVETSKVRGSCEASPASSAIRSSRIGSIAAEWKAKSRSRARNARPRRRASAPSRSIASLGPETVTDCVALIAPSSSGLPISSSNSAAPAFPSASAAMRPSPRVRSCCRLRATTTREASSRDKAPEAHAAPIRRRCGRYARPPRPRAHAARRQCRPGSQTTAAERCRRALTPSASAPCATISATDQPRAGRSAASAWRLRRGTRRWRGRRRGPCRATARHCRGRRRRASPRQGRPGDHRLVLGPGGEIGERGDLVVGAVGAERHQALRCCRAGARRCAQGRLCGRRRRQQVVPTLRHSRSEPRRRAEMTSGSSARCAAGLRRAARRRGRERHGRWCRRSRTS